MPDLKAEEWIAVMMVMMNSLELNLEERAANLPGQLDRPNCSAYLLERIVHTSTI